MPGENTKILRASSILCKKKIRELKNQYARKERRASERFPANLEARFFYGNMIYTGKVINFSKNGMFISTKVPFPLNSEFIMVVLLDNQTAKIPIKVRRKVSKKGDYYSRMNNGVGIELMVSPQSYLNYVRSQNPSANIL